MKLHLPERVLVDEILDSLPPDDPDAIASRKDLLRLNRFFGNFKWIERALANSNAEKVVELGAGDAHLARQVVEKHAEMSWTAIDLAPRPADLPESVNWRQGDIFEQLPNVEGDALVANLFLHHLSTEKLRELGQQLLRFRVVIVNEPYRCVLYHIGGYAMRLFWLNRVTRHDLHASVDAGFRENELPEMLGLDPKIWRIRTERTLRGMYRLIAENAEKPPRKS